MGLSDHKSLIVELCNDENNDKDTDSEFVTSDESEFVITEMEEEEECDDEIGN